MGVPGGDEQERLAKSLGVHVEELRFGPRPRWPEPWTKPLERATRPTLALRDERYEKWLRYTLADVAAHFASAYVLADFDGADSAPAFLQAARVLRALVVALELGDSRKLAELGDVAGTYLRAQSGKTVRVPTAMCVEKTEGGGLIHDPPFEIDVRDLVEVTRVEAATELKRLVVGPLWMRRNPTPTTPWLREAARELAMFIVMRVRASKIIAKECLNLDDVAGVEEMLVRRLPEVKSRELPELSAKQPRVARRDHPQGSYEARLALTAESYELAAEDLVRHALRVLGYPAKRARSLYDTARHGKKRGP